MIHLTQPKFFIPVHGGALRRTYHAELGIEEGLARNNSLVPDNGDSFFFTAESVEPGGPVAHGSLLVDQNGKVVNGIVVKDRLMLSEEGIMAVILTIDKKTGQLLTSPDIISRGFIAVKENKALMDKFRAELRRAVSQRFTRVDIDRFKAEMRDYMTHFLFEQTGRSPIVIPVVNVIGNKAETKTAQPDSRPQSHKDTTAADQKRFQEMRARLLGQDQRD